MIQRLQSIYLLLASVAVFLLLVFPLANSTTSMHPFFEDQEYTVWDSPILVALTFLTGGLVFFNIFLFRKRKLQIRLDFGFMLLVMLIPVIAILLIFLDGPEYLDTKILNINYLGVLMPIIAIVFAILANRNITKDVKIVENMDRLR